MSGKLITPCSLTRLMFPGKGRSVKGFEKFSRNSGFISLLLQIRTPKFAVRNNTETIGSDNLKEIARHF